jgi:hypothetical protein
MPEALFGLVAFLRSRFGDQRELALENLALRHHAILARTHPHPRSAKSESKVLGLALSNLGKLAGVIDRRKTGYSGSMASEKVSPILDAAVETKACWSSRNRDRNQRFNPKDSGS